MDNDVYGHVNNVAYYSFFDTGVNRYLIEQGALDLERGEVIGLVAETSCRFFRPLSFPDEIEVCIRADHVGTTSVRYGVAIARRGESEPAAAGHFVHVYVDRATRRPTALPPALRAAVESLFSVPGSDS